VTDPPAPTKQSDSSDSGDTKFVVVARVPAKCRERPRRPPTFQRFAQSTARIVGTAGAFCAAMALIVVWAVTGPLFHFSDTWQLVINTSTTIITFLMVFVIQHTQNRDTEALRLKLDELIRAMSSARNDFINLEDLDDQQLQALHDEFQSLREERPSREQSRTPVTAEE